jgi:hypothetical protein
MLNASPLTVSHLAVHGYRSSSEPMLHKHGLAGLFVQGFSWVSRVWVRASSQRVVLTP